MKVKYVLWCALASLGALFPWLGGAEVPPDGRLPFTESEIRAILSHGPWPVPGTNDPSNRVSGKREAIEFGERLFFDTRLSGSGRFSCGTCHVPERNWTDNQTRGAAVAPDGPQHADAHERAARPLRSAGTARRTACGRRAYARCWTRASWASSARQSPSWCATTSSSSCRYRKTFGSPPSATDDEAVLVDIGKALAAFQETLAERAHALRQVPRRAGARRAHHALAAIPRRRSAA